MVFSHLCFPQENVDIISNWDEILPTWQVNGGIYETVDNPDTSGINKSLKCGKFTTSADDWDFILLDMVNPADYNTFPIYKVRVLAPASGKLIFKMENVDNTQNIGFEVFPTAGVWQEFEFDLSTCQYTDLTKIVIFFDLYGNVIGREWYVDDVVRVGTGEIDTEPPTIPGNLSASYVSSSRVILDWDESTDNVGVLGYKLFINDEYRYSTSISRATVVELDADTLYTFGVSAYDMGNETETATIQATTQEESEVVPSTYNYRLSTQSIGAGYNFTNRTRLVETAEEIMGMGSNILKVSLNVNSEFYSSLRELVQNDPSYIKLFEMDFTYYILWVYGPSNWYDGQTTGEGTAEYNAIYDLAKYFLEEFSGTGKKFYIGHWEGDWHLVDDWNTYQDPLDPNRVQGMIDWLNVRQDAIDAAEADADYNDVEIYQYTELNLVNKARDGYPSLLTDVLPYTDVDYVSYSSYECTAAYDVYYTVNFFLKRNLDYIEEYLPEKQGLPEGKRVWIGEYGYPVGRNYSQDPNTQEEQDKRSRYVMRTGLEWGCPFVLYWEMYNNEINDDGSHNGFWMIDNNGEPQKILYTHWDYHDWAKAFVEDYIISNGEEPSEEVFTTAAANRLAETSSTEEDGSTQIPSKIKVHKAYPNPFNPTMNVVYEISEPLKLKVSIYDITGREIKILYKDNITPGEYHLSWNATDKLDRKVGSGVYFLNISADDYFQTQKLLLLK